MNWVNGDMIFCRLRNGGRENFQYSEGSFSTPTTREASTPEAPTEHDWNPSRYIPYAIEIRVG